MVIKQFEENNALSLSMKRAREVKERPEVVLFHPE